MVVNFMKEPGYRDWKEKGKKRPGLVPEDPLKRVKATEKMYKKLDSEYPLPMKDVEENERKQMLKKRKKY